MHIVPHAKSAKGSAYAGFDLLLVAVDRHGLEAALAEVDLPEAAKAQLVQVAAAEHFGGRAQEHVCTHVAGAKGAAVGVALLGTGEALAKPTGEAWVRLGGRAARMALQRGAKAPLLLVPGRAEHDDKAHLQGAVWLAQGLHLGAYQNVSYKSAQKADERPRPVAPKQFALHLAATQGVAQALDVGTILAESVCLARELVNAPANVLGPPEYAERVRALCRTHKLSCKVLDERQLAAEGMHLHLGVGQGSTRPPRLVHVAYDGDGEGAESVALIGKGITFDSGGLCLKPADSMATMKMDMGGSAAVLATLVAAARLALPVRLHGVLALAENMPDGQAIRPGDILTSAKGLTVEVNNTDAEGRLVLADAMHWTQKHLAPDLMVDVATLTGACMVALGPKTAGLMSNRDALADALAAAAKDAGEDVWRLPLTAGLGDQLKSDVADLRNTGERLGGAITAGLFLQRFVEGTAWAHLDIAGPAWATDEGPHWRRGGTGAGCATLIRWLMRLASGERIEPKKAAHAARKGKASTRRGAAPGEGAAGAEASRPRARRRGGRDR